MIPSVMKNTVLLFKLYGYTKEGKINTYLQYNHTQRANIFKFLSQCTQSNQQLNND